MNNNSNIFYSKVLLFGEYSILLNGMGLTIPFSEFNGSLKFIDDDDSAPSYQSNKELFLFLNYIKQVVTKENSLNNFDIFSFENDLRNGLYFKSIIPQGYGLGSSGAVCAALFQNYGNSPYHQSYTYINQELLSLKNIFSLLESHFHGNSSGLDPLSIFVNHPILSKNKKSLEVINELEKKDFTGFLIDTQQDRQTNFLVNHFLDSIKESHFNRMIKDKLIPLNEKCIHSFLSGNSSQFMPVLKSLSELQVKYFKPMIPEGFHEIFEYGIKTGSYYLKLCGAGGGGFMLGFTRDINIAKHELAKFLDTDLFIRYPHETVLSYQNMI